MSWFDFDGVDCMSWCTALTLFCCCFALLFLHFAIEIQYTLCITDNSKSERQRNRKRDREREQVKKAKGKLNHNTSMQLSTHAKPYQPSIVMTFEDEFFVSVRCVESVCGAHGLCIHL